MVHPIYIPFRIWSPIVGLRDCKYIKNCLAYLTTENDIYSGLFGLYFIILTLA